MLAVKKYLSLVKFSHTIFAMPFALIGFFLGLLKNSYSSSVWSLNRMIGWNDYVVPGWHTTIYPKWFLPVKFTLVILSMIFARSAAMAFNRWLDAKYDAMNPRTAVREIPAGVIRNILY
jgi:4-hydroxybenzoate polyprenyltransferase